LQSAEDHDPPPHSITKHEARATCARPVAASNSVQPAISFQIQAVPVAKFYAFLFQQASLENVPAIAREAKRHFALGVYDTVPWNVRCRVETLKYPADKAGTPGHAGHRGDLTIGRHPTGRNATNHGANCLGGRIASQRDGRERLSCRERRWLPTCRYRAFDDSRRRTEAGSRPFGRTFHAGFSIARAPPLRSCSDDDLLCAPAILLGPRPKGKQSAPIADAQEIPSLAEIGAGEGIRTLDPDLGKVVLYP
jgi:hypothetical protein